MAQENRPRIVDGEAKAFRLLLTKPLAVRQVIDGPTGVTKPTGVVGPAVHAYVIVLSERFVASLRSSYRPVLVRVLQLLIIWNVQKGDSILLCDSKQFAMC